MNSTTLRVVWVLLGAASAGLTFFLAGANTVELDPMPRLVLGAIGAALAFVLASPTIFARSTLEPGKSEERVVREALSGQPPRGMA